MINKINIALLAITLYLMSGSPYVTIDGRFKNTLFIGIIILFMMLLKNAKTKIRKRVFITGFMTLLFILITISVGVFQNDSIGPYIRLGCIFLFSFLFCCVIDSKSFFHFYTLFIKTISIVDFVIYIVLQIKGQFGFLPTLVNSNGVVYRIGIIYNYIETVPIRNCSIFWEPGLYASHLLFSMMIELFILNSISLKKMCFYHLCLFTTFSSAGIVLLFLIDLFQLYYYISEIKGKKQYGVVLLFFSFVLLIIVIYNFDRILIMLGADKHEFYYKLITSNLSNSLRVKAIIHNLEMVKQSPIIGVGIGEAYRNAVFVEDTSTTTFLFAELGIIGLFPTILTITGAFCTSNNKLTSLFLVFLFLSIINKEPHSNMVICWVIIYYFITEQVSLIKRSNSRGGEYV